MIKKVTAGDTDANLKDAIAQLAAEMGTAKVDIATGVYDLAMMHAGEIGGSDIVQDPAWRGTVDAARGQKKKG